MRYAEPSARVVPGGRSMRAVHRRWQLLGSHPHLRYGDKYLRRLSQERYLPGSNADLQLGQGLHCLRVF